MADKMGTLFTIVLGLSILALTCVGQQLIVKHAPSYVVFQQQTPDTPVSSSDLHSIIASPLGLSNKPNSVMKSKSVLKRPKANVLITVATHKEQQDLPLEGQAKFPLDWDLPFVDMEQLMNQAQSKFSENPVMLDLVSTNRFFDVKTTSDLFQSLPSSFTSAKERLRDPDSFLFGKNHKTASLNASLSSDEGLFTELQMMRDVVDKLKQNAGKLATGTPDLLSLTLTGLKGIGDEYGPHSAQSKEAQDLVAKHLDEITQDLKTTYRGNVMIEILTVPSFERPNVRKTRSLKAAVGEVDNSRLNLALAWDEDYPVAFNICLWLVVLLVITFYFIAYGIWNMNPNLESILYRVPQDENKKLN